MSCYFDKSFPLIHSLQLGRHSILCAHGCFVTAAETVAGVALAWGCYSLLGRCFGAEHLVVERRASLCAGERALGFCRAWIWLCLVDSACVFKFSHSWPFLKAGEEPVCLLR